MARSLTIACIQMTSGPDILQNLEQAGTLIAEVTASGATFIATPENTDFMRESPHLTLQTAPEAEAHPAIPFFSSLARDKNITLLVGSIKIKAGEKTVNRSLLFGKDGQIIAQYDKIHLFDVDLPNGEQYRESNSVSGGGEAPVISSSRSGLGEKMAMTICYDVRFPALYRALAQKGAGLITVPAAFTQQTGQAHWHILLRARAIENGCFIVAPAQVGTHEGGRKTFGHSMIISPWGKILAEQTEDKTGWIAQEIDWQEVEHARNAIPSLRHDKEFLIKEI